MKITQQGSRKKRDEKVYVDQEVSVVRWKAKDGVLRLITVDNPHMYQPDKRHFNCWVELLPQELDLLLNELVSAGLIKMKFSIEMPG